eukprot:gene1863-56269_t
MNPIPRMGQPNAGCLPNTCQGHCASFAPRCPQDCSVQANCTHPCKNTDPGTWQGACSGDWKGGQIVDTVIIPKDITPGEYVLGWRWDCEETTQIWQSCAD